MRQNSTLDKKHILSFDDSGLRTSLDYLRNRSEQSLKKLVAASGNKLAYAHNLWSSNDTKTTIEKFWSVQLSKISWNPELERNISDIKAYLLEQKKTKWLNEVLRYLPRRHFFSTTIYLNVGYDHIVFGENIALNLNSHQFHEDKRESVYYLIHELAHAGYVRYHSLPKLWNVKTNTELLNIVKFLTHLEGMGVISALKLRILEDGLLDNDYKTLLNNTEKAERVNHYFRLLDKLESNQSKKVDENYPRFFEKMSGKKTRLWYITGCHMAQEIEKHKGTEALRNLVRKGSDEFFSTYLELTDPPRA